jgi:DNA mismatch repair protein MutL
LDPIISLYGVDIAKKMLRVDFKNEEVYISGFTSMPELSRSSRGYEFLYVNSRAVYSQLLSEAIEEAYKTLLMKHRYPITVLNLTIKSSAVDVNIHPTKREIKFADANEIFALVKKAISSALAKKELWRKNIGLIKKAGNNQAIQTTFNNNDGSISIDSHEEAFSNTSQGKENTSLAHITVPDSRLTFKKIVLDNNLSADKKAISSLSSESLTVFFSDDFWLRPLGMALNLYVLCETNQGVAIVDIHATHERIRYEELITKYEKSQIEKQELLEPITVTLPADKLAFIQDFLPELEKIGIVFEFFGGNTYIIRQLPVVMDLAKTEEDILSFIDEMHNESPKVKAMNNRIDLILKTMACHSAVRAGDLVSLSKIATILRQLASCRMPYTCPHGRPTIIRIPVRDLEKEFGRIV